MSWADTEFETLDLGDQRLNNRAIKLLDDFSAKPTASIPQACAAGVRYSREGQELEICV